MDFESDNAFSVVTTQLPAAGIDCLMIGGHAVNHYGVSRATQDIDFMVAVADESAVRTIMQTHGYSNVSTQQNVLFFNKPGSALRIDFLKVDRPTLDSLLQRARTVKYFGQHRVLVPALRDLLAMKIFALHHGGPRRQDKDLPDIANLVLANQFPVDSDLRQLCTKFGDPALFERLRQRIEELNRA